MSFVSRSTAAEASSTTEYVLWAYDPSLKVAIIFAFVFVLTTSYHTLQVYRMKAWFFIPMVIGGYFEWVGYVARAYATQNLTSLGPYIWQTLLLLLAPSLFAASIYMTLGRMMVRVNGEQWSIISRQWLTKVFVSGDVLSFLLQATGGAVMSSQKSNSRDLGNDILIPGLFVQLIFFGVFMITAVVWHMRFNHHRKASSNDANIPWRKHMNVLYFTSVLIFIRSVYRVIEYLIGTDSFLQKHEAFLLIFDTIPMLIVMIVFNVVHPGEILCASRKFPARNGDLGVPLADRDDAASSIEQDPRSVSVQNLV